MKMVWNNKPRGIVVGQSGDLRSKIGRTNKNSGLALLRHSLARYGKRALTASTILASLRVKGLAIELLASLAMPVWALEEGSRGTRSVGDLKLEPGTECSGNRTRTWTDDRFTQAIGGAAYGDRA